MVIFHVSTVIFNSISNDVLPFNPLQYCQNTGIVSAGGTAAFYDERKIVCNIKALTLDDRAVVFERHALSDMKAKRTILLDQFTSMP